MKGIPFVKLSGAGNDFIAINQWKHRFAFRPSLGGWTRAVCDRTRSIGADGVLLLEPSRSADVKMRIINADGSEAEMCGNGVRCLARLAHLEGVRTSPRMTVETLSGIKTVVLKGGEATVDMGPPRNERFGIALTVKGRAFKGDYVDTGVPHAVLFSPAKSLDASSLQEIGRVVRFHRVFRPRGTNVDFVWPRKKHEILARVYERGVEGETLACGTGACASAYMAVRRRKAEWPVTVMTSGGDRLHIDCSSEGHLIMTGPIKVICRGELFEDAWKKTS